MTQRAISIPKQTCYELHRLPASHVYSIERPYSFKPFPTVSREIWVANSRAMAGMYNLKVRLQHLYNGVQEVSILSLSLLL